MRARNFLNLRLSHRTLSCCLQIVALATLTLIFAQRDTLSAAESGKVPGLSGRLPGAVKVESGGSATYSIPVLTPPPTAGLGPNLAFVYSSQGGNGLLGMGWSISGLPVIDRCPQTFAQDNFAGGVNLDSGDRFCMDGARLNAVSGAYGAPGTEYRTEVDKFVKVISYGSVAGGSGPQYFKAWTKDGLIMEFGNSPTSAIAAQGKSTIRVWALNKLQDRKGNYLKVSYFIDNGQGHYRPDRIDYTYNDAAGVTTATRSVRFTAEPRTDVWPMYLAGSKVTIPDRITHVTTYVGETPVRDYVLQYEYGTATKRSRLKSITECAGATCMPAHVFEWQEGGDGAYTQTPPGGFNQPNNNWSRDYVWVGDMNGDGKTDLVTVELGKLYTYGPSGPYPDLLVKITNPFQGKNEITYKPITDGSVYAKDTPETAPQYVGSYPDIDVQFPLYVVSNLTVSDNDNSYLFSHIYGGGKVNLHGRGWLGFRTMEVVDSSAGSRQTTFFNQYFPKTGLPHIQETERTSDGAMLLDIESKYCDPVNDLAPCLESFPGVKQVLMKRMETDEREGQATTGRLTAKTFEHDVFGNLTLTLHEGVVNTADSERREETAWAMNVGEWLFRPHTTILREGSSPTGEIRRQKFLFYDGNNSSLNTLGSAGLLTKEEIDAGGGMGNANNPVFTYTYNNFANRETVTDVRRNCTTTTLYETAHNTYPSSVIACSNLTSPKFTTTFDYWPEHGGIKRQTDVDNNATATFLYDAFGRPTQVTNQIDFDAGSPNGTETYSYPAWGTPDVQRVVISKTEEHGQAGVLETEHYFDGFGRVDLTSTEGPEATSPKIIVQNVYDSRGLLRKKSVPRFVGDTIRWTEFTYDARGRETQVIYPDGTSVNRVYNPGKVTITDQRGKQRVQLFDAYGRLAQLQEKSGLETFLTDYTYDAAGALLTTTNHLDHVTTMNYDLAGRKTSMQDPNTGSWTYTYFPSGDLASQTDAKQQTLCFAYDPLGRSTAKWQGQTQGQTPNCLVVVTNLFTWTYDTSSLSPPPPLAADNPKGRLTKVVDNVTLAETRFAYDKLGRVTETQRSIDGVHTLDQTYDALNHIKSETFSDELTQPITYTYNNAGWLKSVTGYVTDIQYNARGQKTAIQYGNGIISSFTYDETDTTPSFRLQRRQTTYSGGTHNLNALTGWGRSWTTSPTGFINLYRGGICVANGSGNCIGGDSMIESGVGPAIGYISTVGGFGTVPVYRSTCYSSAGSCTGWGLSLDINGSPAGYLSATAPDAPSAASPFIQSNGLLFQGLTGTASAYLWTSLPQNGNHTTHLYLSPGPAPDGYTSEGITGYIDQASTAGTVPLYRFANSMTGHYYYSTVSDAPAGFSTDGTLGYLHTAGGSGLTALNRHYNSTTGDYLLTTSSSPPSGYVLQATLGYLHTSAGTTGAYQDLTYQFDNGGNLTAITDALWTGSREFAYDDLNRLTSAAGNFGPSLAEITHGYSYDAIGNILNKAGVLYSYPNHPQHPSLPGNCPGPVHPSAVAATSDGKQYCYDENGNTTTGAGRTLTWNVENRVASVSGADMVYDHTGIRIKKTVGAASTYFPFAGYEVTGTLFTKYIRVGNETLAAKKGGEKLFYHTDHLGSVNVITDIWAVMVQLNEYDPWGKVSRAEGNVEETKRFTGKELDPESELYYYGGRYYDGELSRFVSADPFIQSPSDPQNFNRYSYVLNRPQIFIDPTGYEYETSSGEYSIPLLGWAQFFKDLFDWFSGDDKKPDIRLTRKRHVGFATPHHQPAARKGTQGEFENICKYTECPERGGDPSRGTGNAGNDYPGGGLGGPLFIQPLRNDKPANNKYCVEFSSSQQVLISLLRPAASYWNQTIGLGLGGSAGGGRKVGASFSYSNQILVSPTGEVGVQETVTSAAGTGPFAITSTGLGAWWGLQFSVSNATTPQDVAGLGANAGAGYADLLAVGQDFTFGKGTQGQFVIQATTTVGFGLGLYGHALSTVGTTVTPICPR